MIIFLACAKIMTGVCTRSLPLTTEPLFQLRANENAIQMASYSSEALMRMLRVNADIAQENWWRYQHFFDEEVKREPAAFAYDGMVFRKLAPESFSDSDLIYANDHLLIGSFLYGLLRPLDLVKKYRMEGSVTLPENKGLNMFDYWKPLLTDCFIQRIKADDGILLNLASEEMKFLFDWKKVAKEVRVVTPEFYTMKDGKPKTIVIYTKMCRGAMTRYVLQNRITSLEDLKSFQHEGFCHDESETDKFEFILS